MTQADPICGNCGKPRSQHETEAGLEELFCYSHTTGDVFSDEPGDCAIIDLLHKRHPDIHTELVATWRTTHGHE